MNVLPNSILIHLFSFLNAQELGNCSKLSIEFNIGAQYVLELKIKEIIECYYPLLEKDTNTITSKSAYLHDLVRPRVLVIRGFIAWSMDITKKLWTRCHDSRRDRGHFAAVFYRGEIFAIGTYSIVASGTVEKYNPFNDTWTSVAPLPRKLRSVGAAVVNDKLFVTGGIEITEVVTDEIFEYNPTKNRWVVNKTTLKYPRCRHASVTFDSCIWIAGGCFENGNATNSVEIYDPVHNRTTDGPSMLVRRDFANLLVVKGNLYAVGGDMSAANKQLKRTIEMYNKDTKKWQHVTEFKDERKGFSTTVYGSKIYVFGGTGSIHDEEDYDSNSWDAFDVETLLWESEVVIQCGKYFKMPPIDTWGQAVTYPTTDRITWS